jgi:hypothetical protein
MDRRNILSIGAEDARTRLEGQDRRVPRVIFRFAVHLLLATIGSVVIGVILLTPIAFTGDHPGLLGELLTDAPYSPAFWLSGLPAGFVVNTLMRDRSAFWTGPVCIVLLAAMILTSIRGYQNSIYERQQSHNSFFAVHKRRAVLLRPQPVRSQRMFGKVVFYDTDLDRYCILRRCLARTSPYAQAKT